MKKSLLAILVLAIVLGAVFFWQQKAEAPGVTPTSITTGADIIKTEPLTKFWADKEGGFFVEGRNLDKVEIWASVGGNEISMGPLVKLGDAKRIGEADIYKGIERWNLFPIPSCGDWTRIFARGTDKQGKTAEIWFPYFGAKEIRGRVCPGI